MKKYRAMLAAALALTPAAMADDFKFGRFDQVHVTLPSGEPQSVAILLSGEGGWDKTAADTASALAAHGAAVLGVDYKVFKAKLDAKAKGCIYPSADLQELAQFGEKELHFKHYLQPILVGLGEAGSFVYPAFAQPPKDTFKGALGAGFCPTLNTKLAMCQGNSKDLKSTKGAGGYSYAPSVSGLDNFVVLNGVPDQKCKAADVDAFIAASGGSKSIAYDTTKTLQDQVVAAYDTLAGTQTDFENAQSSEAGAPGEPSTPPAPAEPTHVDISALSDLSLTVVPAAGTPSSYAIFMTGDGGWAGIDQEISEVLASKGTEIIGFNTLDYYWEEKSAYQTAADLNRVFDAIRASDPNAKVMLIGYSFGAEVLPVAYPNLAQGSKTMVQRMVLMVPGDLAVFEFSTSYWVGGEPSEGANVEQAIRGDVNVPVLCLYSTDDDGACPKLEQNKPANVTLKTLGEGHHFGGDYGDLANIILNGG